ncbi:MAG: zonular occludens toxin domain-containing protein [Clostridium sp.]|nr:zonular occludens toxin domain-containing protein [Clostridium sp.]
MIELYSGTPGSGKSLDCAKIIVNRMCTKNCVTIANFPIEEKNVRGKVCGHFLYIDNEFLTVDRLVDFSMNYSKYLKRKLKEDEVLLIIDEAQLLFGAREWDAAGRKQWLWFFEQHRKLGYKVILCAQFDRMLDRNIRGVLEYEIIHRKVTNIGKVGKLVKLFCFGDTFVTVRMWYPMKMKVGSDFFRINKKLYSIYDTNIIFQSKACVDDGG